MKEKTTFIYTLKCPITNEVKYVGKTNNTSNRVNQHIYRVSLLGDHVHEKDIWINTLKQNNKKPIIEVLDEVPLSEWDYWERFWIIQMMSWGFNLTNIRKGGNGYGFHPKETIEKISKSLSGKNNPMYGVESWSKGKKLKPTSEETKEKISKANKGNTAWNKDKKYSNEKLRGNTNRVGKKHSEETKRKISESMKNYESLKGRTRSEETKKKISESLKRVGHKPPSPKGRVMSEEAKQHLREKALNRKRNEKGYFI